MSCWFVAAKESLPRAGFFVAAGHGRDPGARRPMILPARKDRELMEPGGGVGCAGAGFRRQPAFRERRRGNGVGIWFLSLLR